MVDHRQKDDNLLEHLLVVAGIQGSHIDNFAPLNIIEVTEDLAQVEEELAFINAHHVSIVYLIEHIS
jgi:hypothetical protein